jgi:hypothetical protein
MRLRIAKALRYYLDWSATAPMRGENIVPRVVPTARIRDQAAGEGIDQPSCTTELLNSRGVRE